MFGAYRLVLAVLVAISHLGLLNAGLFEAGPFAVIGFFFISGFVMTRLYQKYFITLGAAKAYFAERAIRILPQYYFFVALTLFLLYMFGRPAGADFVSGRLDALTIVANIAIIPLDFYMFSPRIASMSLLPQAFSLGIELMFYLLVPFFVVMRSLRIWAFLASAAIFTAAFFGIFDPDTFGYRLLPGALIFFFMGMYLADKDDTNRLLAMLVGYALFAILLSILLLRGASGPSYKPVMFSELVGALVGFPIVAYLSSRPMSRADTALGSASYGVFLCHVAIIWWLKKAGIFSGPSTVFGAYYFPFAVLTLSVAVGFIGYFLVEMPFVRMRHRARVRASKMD